MNDKRLFAILQSVKAINSTLTLDEMLETFIKELLCVIKAADSVIIFIYDKEQNLLIPKKSHGYISEDLKKVNLKPGEGISGQTFFDYKSNILQDGHEIAEKINNLSKCNQYFFKKALGKKMPSSIISAPLIYKERCLGAMTIDNFSGKPFVDEDLEILLAFAGHASIAIENTRLYENQVRHLNNMQKLYKQLKDNNKHMKKTMEIYHNLTNASIAGEGLHALCKRLSQIINKHVVIYDDFSQVMGCTQYLNKATEKEVIPIIHKMGQERRDEIFNMDDQVYYAKSIIVNNALVGIVIIFPLNIKEDDIYYLKVATNIACTIFALEIMKEQNKQDTRYKVMGKMLDELLEGKDQSSLLERLHMTTHGQEKKQYAMFAVAIDNPRNYDIDVFYYENKQLFRILQKALHVVIPDAIILEKNDCVYMLVSSSDDQLDQKMNKVINIIREEMILRNVIITISTFKGRIVDNTNKIKESYKDTKMCLDYVKRTKKINQNINYKQLGIKRLLFKNEKADLERFIDDILGALGDYDEKNSSDFLTTLITFVKNDRSVKETSKQLNIHINTLYYRINKIEELIGISKNELDWLQVELALEVYSFLNS